MQEFQFNCLTTANHIMGIANRRHYAAIQAAHDRQDARAERRAQREHRRNTALDAALIIAAFIGLIATNAALCAY